MLDIPPMGDFLFFYASLNTCAIENIRFFTTFDNTYTCVGSLYSINREALQVTNCTGDVVQKLAETVQTTICDYINNNEGFLC